VTLGKTDFFQHLGPLRRVSEPLSWHRAHSL
jgi:hypothetical protein